MRLSVPFGRTAIESAKRYGLCEARKLLTYGADALSARVLAVRRNLPFAKRYEGNFAVLEYELANGQKVIGTPVSSRGKGLNGPHSEKQLVLWTRDELPSGARVTRVFSERQPCTMQNNNCDKLLSNALPGAEVTFAVEYVAGQGQGKPSYNALKTLLKEAGL
jgi:hypothetical protein